MMLNGRGGKRPGAGRPEGAQNKVTVELRGAAQAYTADALKTLHEICTGGQSEAARVAAACAILDRAYGKPSQQLDVTTNATFHAVEPASATLAWLEQVIGVAEGRPLPPASKEGA